MKKTEKVTIYFLLLSSLFLSLIYVDLYPFSLNPLFTKKTSQYSFINVKDQNNKILSNGYLGIFLEYGSQFEKAGIRKKDSINRMGDLISRERLESHLINQLKDLSFIEKLQVNIFNVTANRRGLERVKHAFEIKNPHFDSSINPNHPIYNEDKYQRRIKNEVFFGD